MQMFKQQLCLWIARANKDCISSSQLYIQQLQSEREKMSLSANMDEVAEIVSRKRKVEEALEELEEEIKKRKILDKVYILDAW